MALKADRYELQTDISFFMNETAEKGIVVHISTVGSGAAMDQGAAKVVKKATPSNSDVPFGILLNDVVNKDLTRTHLNQHKDEVQLGGKVTVLRKGYIVTDQISGTPAAGEWALASDNGTVSGIADAGIENRENLRIGKFLSTKDADGYCKVEVNLP